MARGLSPKSNGGASLGSTSQKWNTLFAQNIDPGANMNGNYSLGYRKPSTSYTFGQKVRHPSLRPDFYLMCVTAGTTGSGSLTVSDTSFLTAINDGSVVWNVVRSSTRIDITATASKTSTTLVDAIQSVFESVDPHTWPPQTYTGRFGMLKAADDTTPLNKNGSGCYSLTVTTNLNYGTSGMLSYGNHLYSVFYGNGTWTVTDMVDVVQSVSIGSGGQTATGYMKFSSGLIMQFGLVDASEVNISNNVWKIQLPISMTAVCGGAITGFSGYDSPTFAYLTNVDSAGNTKTSNSQIWVVKRNASSNTPVLTGGMHYIIFGI